MNWGIFHSLIWTQLKNCFLSKNRFGTFLWPTHFSPTIICKNCGKQGHVSAVCPTKKPPEQIHAIATEPDGASVSSEDNSILILAQVHSPPPDGTILTQDVTQMPRCPISLDLLLLDSQSTVHLFSQPDHVHNIRLAKNPIRVHCNKGTLETT